MRPLQRRQPQHQQLQEPITEHQHCNYISNLINLIIEASQHSEEMTLSQYPDDVIVELLFKCPN